jgi:hypothetical protein
MAEVLLATMPPLSRASRGTGRGAACSTVPTSGRRSWRSGAWTSARGYLVHPENRRAVNRAKAAERPTGGAGAPKAVSAPAGGTQAAPGMVGPTDSTRWKAGPGPGGQGGGEEAPARIPIKRTLWRGRFMNVMDSGQSNSAAVRHQSLRPMWSTIGVLSSRPTPQWSRRPIACAPTSYGHRTRLTPSVGQTKRRRDYAMPSEGITRRDDIMMRRLVLEPGEAMACRCLPSLLSHRARSSAHH